MSIDQIIPLAVIVGAFVLFAVVLAWGLEEGRQKCSRRVSDCQSSLAAAVRRPTAGRGVITTVSGAIHAGLRCRCPR